MTNVPFDIYTVGGIEFLSQVYKGLVMVFGASQFNTMIKLFTAFGFIGAILMVAAKNKVSLFTNHIIGAFVLFNMFFSIKSDVTIIDTMYNRTYVVSNVPIGPAFVSSLASSGSYVITNLLTNAFHTGTVNVYDSAGSGQNAWSSTTLDYQGTGYGGYFKRLNDLKKMGLSNFQTKDMSVLYGMAKTYLKDCKMPEYAFMSDDSFYTAVMKSTNLLESIAPEVNGLMNYNGTQYECVNFYDTVLKPKWNAVVPAFVADSKNFAYLGVTPDTVAGLQAGIAESLKLGSAALSDMIMVAGIGCAINASYQDYIGGGSQANPVNLAMAFEVCRNIEESKQMGKQLGLYALETIPMMKIAMETLFIALSPVLVLLLFIPGNLKVIKGFVMTIAWIYMWDPVLAAINGIVNIAAIAKVQAALEASGAVGAFTLEATNIMYNAVDYIPAVAGYLGISAPGIALMLIKGGEITMANIASMMANPVMSTPIHQEAAQSAAISDVARQTGKSHGSVMMASLSRPWETAAAVGRMKTYDELGASTLSDAAYGHDINAAAKGVGEANVHRKLGLEAFQREVAAMEGLQRDSVLRGEVTGQVIQERGEATYKAGLKGGMEQSIAGGVAAGKQGYENLEKFAGQKLQQDMATTEGTWAAYGGDTALMRDVARVNASAGIGSAGAKQDVADRHFGGDVAGMTKRIEAYSTASQLGMQQKDIMKASALGFVNKEDVDKGLWGNVNAGLMDYKKWDGVVTDPMATRLQGMGYTGVQAGMRVNSEKDLGINTETGKVEFLRGEISGTTYSGRLAGNRLEQAYVSKDGTDVNLVTNTDTGKVSHGEGVRVLDKTTRVGGYTLGSGTTVRQSIGEDGRMMMTYTGVINGKEGHLTLGADGRPVYADGKSGHDFRQQDVDLKERQKGFIDITHDEQGRVFFRGVEMKGSLYSVMTNDTGYLEGMTNIRSSQDIRNAIRLRAAESLGNEIGQFVKMDSKEAGRSIISAYASMGIKSPSFIPVQIGAGGKVEVSNAVENMTTTDMLKFAHIDIMQRAEQAGRAQGLSEQQLKSHINAKVREFDTKLLQAGQHRQEITKPTPGQKAEQASKDTVDPWAVGHPVHPAEQPLKRADAGIQADYPQYAALGETDAISDAQNPMAVSRDLTPAPIDSDAQRLYETMTTLVREQEQAMDKQTHNEGLVREGSGQGTSTPQTQPDTHREVLASKIESVNQVEAQPSKAEPDSQAHIPARKPEIDTKMEDQLSRQADDTEHMQLPKEDIRERVPRSEAVWDLEHSARGGSNMSAYDGKSQSVEGIRDRNDFVGRGELNNSPNNNPTFSNPAMSMLTSEERVGPEMEPKEAAPDLKPEPDSRMETSGSKHDKVSGIETKDRIKVNGAEADQPEGRNIREADFRPGKKEEQKKEPEIKADLTVKAPYKTESSSGQAEKSVPMKRENGVSGGHSEMSE